MTQTVPAPVAKVAPAFGLVLVALGIVYVVWGSTYLAIRIVVEQAPPLTSMGLRYSTAAVVLGALLSLQGGVRRLRLTRRQALGTAFLGLMLPLLGNGMVSVAENLGAPSGVAALLIAVAPLMIVVFRFAEGDRPRPLTAARRAARASPGSAVLVLVGGGAVGGFPVGPALLVMFASTCWAFGSYVQPRLWLPQDVFVTTVYEMLFGGLLLLTVGRLSGESFTAAAYSPRTWTRAGLPRRVRLGRRVHVVRLAAGERADLLRGDLRLRQPGRRGVPRLAGARRARHLGGRRRRRDRGLGGGPGDLGRAAPAPYVRADEPSRPRWPASRAGRRGLRGRRRTLDAGRLPALATVGP